ncbi:MAG: hypothetical protein QNJ98_00720 [Planctomycetota bacterium]|nr:hypothetical protein [Planctomycetota bacterium]
MRCVRGLLVLVLLVSTGLEASGDDLRIPGLKADERATALLTAWQAKRYALGKAGTHRAACTLWIEGVKAPKPKFLEGDFLFDYFMADYDWRVSKGDGVFERGWWRAEFEALQLDLGRLPMLRGSTLTAKATASGTDIHVRGPSPLRILRFDREGVLTGLQTGVPGPEGKIHLGEVRFTYQRWNDLYLVRRFVLETRFGVDQRQFEEGTIKWVRVQGRPVPVRMDLVVGQDTTRMDMTLWMRGWRFGSEVGPKLVPEARKAVEAYEATAYNPGRWRYVRGTCQVVAPGVDGKLVRGTYHYDGRTGRLTWPEAKRHAVVETEAWRHWLDRVFERYWLRKQLGPFAPKVRKDGTRTVLETRTMIEYVEVPLDRTLVFASNGTLAEVRDHSAQMEVTEISRYTYQRVLRSRGVPFHVPFPHYLPTRLERITQSSFRDPPRSIETMTWARVQGLSLPRTLEIEVHADGKHLRATLTFEGWNLVRESLDLSR